MIYARQWAFADLRQNAEMNGSFFVRGRVRHGVGVAARQPVHGTFDRIHGHVQFFALHSVGDQRAHEKLSVARSQLHPGAAPNPALFRELR